MATRRQLDRLMQQVQRLNQSDEYWTGTSRLTRMWVTPKQAPPYRPYVTLWLSQDGKIVSSKAQSYPPTTDDLLEELLQAMRRPALGAGRARRPSRLYMDSAEDVAVLAPLLATLRIACVYRPTLAMADAVMAEMEAQVGGYVARPGLVSIPSVTPPLLGHLYELAAQFYQRRPWGWFHDRHPFAIACPPEASPRYAIVMGSGGEVFGLAVYDRLEDLRSVFTSPVAARPRAQISTWFVLFFEEAPALSFDDLDAMADNNWRVAATHAYPVFGRTTRNQELALPTRSDLLWMEGALGALLAYMDEHLVVDQGTVQPAACTVSVPRVGGETQVHLRLLAFDTLFRDDVEA